VDDDLHVSGSVVIPRAELSWRFSRSSGPGGQGVNTTDSRVQLVFDLAATSCMPAHIKARAIERLGGRLTDGCLVVTSSEQRSQLQNRMAAERRLIAILKEATAPPPRKRRATRPTLASQERRLQAKRSRGQTKRLRRSSGDTD
jgi:ribosome-associated protein